MTTATLFLAGDVMTGRGIDQILPRPGQPDLYEAYVRDARVYVELAERASGPIPRGVEPAYVWGDALDELERAAPHARLVNLETSITVSDDAWPAKGIHYRMHPANIDCLRVADLNGCVLANNHVMDFGYAGLSETLAALEGAGIATTGAGSDLEAARAPAVIETAAARVLVFAFGATSSGIPAEWAAQRGRAGVNLLGELSAPEARRAGERIAAFRREGDVVVASVHWGGNWGYAIPPEQAAFSRALIDTGAVDVVHGHSSHHAKGIEVYRGRPILYGCGDFLTDYEGISGRERYRSGLAPMYLLDIEVPGGALSALTVTVFEIERFQLRRAALEDAAWLKAMLDREGAPLGTGAELGDDGRLALRWR